MLLIGWTATAAAFMATKDGGRDRPAPGADAQGRSAAEDGADRFFWLAMERPAGSTEKNRA
ncbi:hypothetical protein [Pararhizobium sp. IMCC21322]|uniref:hypothetical protein n=1 Tax=Pararhizobium sp. IMCC21322 TaxID=3067903 RepID=UPI002741FE15|nr:hypothetical protein [Pararhizobium sp. IMCC21322]